MTTPETRTIAFLLRRAAISHADRPFIFFGTERYTYQQADAFSTQAASAFMNAGVGVGDHVGILMDNSPAFVWTLLGLAKIAAVAVPLNTAATGKLLSYYIGDSGCRFLVAESRYIEEVERVVDKDVFRAVWVNNPSSNLLDPKNRIRALEEDLGLVEPPREFPVADYRDVALLMYTSGTTGPSKAVIVPHALPVRTAEVVAETFGIDRKDRLYTCLPLFHGNAMWYSMLTAMTVGAAIVLAESFSATRFWDDVADYGATQVNAMGSMIRILQKRAPSAAEKDNALRLAFVVPFPSDPEAFEKRYQAQIATTFGLTEMNPISLSRPGEGYNRPGMAGPVHERFEVAIVDEQDRSLPPGELGEIIVRPNEPWTSFLGYYNKPSNTLDAFRNLWFHTGDIGRLDSDGYLYFVERKKDVIRRRGENISAFELEEILGDHPGLLEVAAVPVPSELTEDDVAVFVVPRPGVEVTEDEVHTFAKRVLPRYMVPRYISIVQKLPKTSTSRVEKYQLRERAQNEKQEIWDAEGLKEVPTQ